MNDLDTNPYVSRGGLKLASANSKFKIDFKDRNVLDVGSSTGGFSDYAIKNGAKKVIAVELGTNQIAESLRINRKLELHEKTDIRDVQPANSKEVDLKLEFVPDIVVVDLSFISLREVLPHLGRLVDTHSVLIVLVKPQFEVDSSAKNKGIIKNESIRRQVLKDFEIWVKDHFVIDGKIDSAVLGTKGNKEKFYLLSKT
jgi:23S rRNA (cytidine1920-2'-O)/16S rRNA (cytidine1409-2'-O)-methyltransferase